MTCKNCDRIAERSGFCATCARQLRKAAAPKAKPARKRIAKQSEEGKERLELYHAIKGLWLLVPVNKICKVCGQAATEPHHMAGRSGDLLYDFRKWLPVCRQCHGLIELHPEHAYEQGWSLSRHQTETI